jgi:hypothetical protein
MAIPSHTVFVDFENVPDIDLGLIAGHPARVVLLIGKNQKKLDLPLVQQIHKLGDRVELIEVGASGRNALDLTLAHYLGRAVQANPALKFHIVSGDKDFDPLIAHLRTTGCAVSRHGSFAALPFLPRPKKSPATAKPATPSTTPPKKPAPAAAAKPPAEDRRAMVITRLSDPAAADRPTRKPRLLAHIKTIYGKQATDAIAAEILATLITRNVVAIDPNGKVSYGTPPP